MATIPSSLPILGSLVSQIYYSTRAPNAIDPGTDGPWRPPQWNGAPAFSMTATDPTTGQSTAYVFDGAIQIDHSQQSVVTLNPVQSGAPITDHVYVQPSRVTVEIMMSDAMDTFTMGQWADGPSKSVSAYEKLVSLQEAGTLVQLATRLRTYGNMVISEVRAVEDKETTYALRATVTFTHILMAQVQTANTNSSEAAGPSAIPQATAQTPVGQVQSQTVPASVTANNNISAISGQFSKLPTLPAAGSWSSTNVSNLGSIFGGN